MAADTMRASNQVASSVQEGMEHTGEAIQNTGAKIRDKASDVAHSVQEMSSQAAQAAQERYNQIRDSASQYLDKGREHAREMGESLQEQIQTRPVSSILVAAGIGFLLGVVLTRR